MVSKMNEKTPVTAAVRVLRAAKVPFSHHLYEYQPHGGTKISAQALGVAEQAVIKTLILEDERAHPLVVLMHGDCEVATGVLAKQLGMKKIVPCDPLVATKHSGYLVGGTSPFGLKKKLPIYVQSSIFKLEKIYLNGGKRGYLVGITPAILQQLLQPILIDAAQVRDFSH